jgi:DNA-binding transcriptional LysR family regulator
MIQLHRLEGFYRVAQAGGYARAARQFPYPITQAGVHAQVHKLEEELGARLFEQVAKDRMVPTRAGRRLLAFCAPFFQALPEVIRGLAHGGGHLRVEAGALEIQEVLPPWLRRLRAQRPEITVELREIDTADHGRLLRDQVDVIVDHQPQVPAGISTRSVAEHRSFLVAAADQAPLRSGRAALTALREHPFVAFPSALPQAVLQREALRASGILPPQIIEAPSVASILSFVAAGLGYSLVPWPTPTGPRIPGVMAIPLRGRGTRFPVLAGWRTRREPDEVLEAFLALGRPASPRTPRRSPG